MAGKDRGADFAGSWYPAEPGECTEIIESFLESAVPCPGHGPVLGGIVPHAGWVFSGQIACNVISCLKPGYKPDTCVIFGRHLHPGGDNFIMAEGAWATPLGSLEIDSALASALTDEISFTVETPERYEQDNTIELQLPFVRYFFPDIRILPVGVPPRSASLELARTIVRLGNDKGRRLVILGSTDLTHYGDNFGFVSRGTGKAAVEWVRDVNDKQAVDLMLDMDAEGLIKSALENHNACCSGAAGAAIAAVKEMGALRAEKLAYATSYDIRPGDSFVGYTGILFQT